MRALTSGWAESSAALQSPQDRALKSRLTRPFMGCASGALDPRPHLVLILKIRAPADVAVIAPGSVEPARRRLVNRRLVRADVVDRGDVQVTPAVAPAQLIGASRLWRTVVDRG